MACTHTKLTRRLSGVQHALTVFSPQHLGDSPVMSAGSQTSKLLRVSLSQQKYSVKAVCEQPRRFFAAILPTKTSHPM